MNLFEPYRNCHRIERYPWHSLGHPDFNSGAILSDRNDLGYKEYRYVLWRQWDIYKENVLFIGLNPSTADEKTDDPTIRRCVNFAKDWGYGAMFMVNLFALRSPDPKYLLKHKNPVGPMNNMWILQMFSDTHLKIAAWGTRGNILNRNKELLEAFDHHKNKVTSFGPLYHLGLTKNNNPKHPLYLKGDTVPILWD